ncbi:MAG TPA: hypothetical protein PLQ13_02110 [Candidatus Krumholzibacteria bacterium]|nr:hypothetical protein [Candidatus Krumholzibacteria bacterium]
MRSKVGIAPALAVLVALLAVPTLAPAQQLIVSCTIATPDATAAPIEFGLAAGALDGIDPFDEPLPPPAPDQSLQVYLQMLTPPVPLPNRWRRDVRPFFDVTAERVELWAMTVESAAVGQAFTFAVETTIDEAPPYTLHVFGPAGLYRLVAPGETFTVPCTAPIMAFFWELQYDEQVAAPPSTWGGVHAQFR